MRREDPGSGAGLPGRASAAEAAALARAAELHGGTAVDEHPGLPAAASKAFGNREARVGGDFRRMAGTGPVAGSEQTDGGFGPADGSVRRRVGGEVAGGAHLLRDVLGGAMLPVLHRGVLTSGTADQLAALTARGAQTPSACIQFVEGEKLRLYGSWGVAEDWAAIADTPLHGSLGGLVVHGGGAVIVDDATVDDRVPDGVVRRHGGAYLGHPVHDRDGQVLGVCCAYDLRPREWSPEQITAVAEAAEVATLLIGEQLARYELEQQHRFLDAVLESLHDGVIACDADGHVVFANERMRRTWADDPRDTDELGLFRALAGEPVRDEPLARPSRTKRTRHFLIDAQPILGPDGRVVGAVQAMQDVTRQRRAERFRSCELAVTTALAEAASIEAAGPRVLEAVVATLDWVHAELWMADAGAAVIRAAARFSTPGWATGIAVPDELTYGQGLAGQAWQVDKPLWIRDVGHSDSVISPDSAQRLHAALAIPVHDGTGTIGVLTVFTDAVEDPEDELVALMSGIAAHLGQFVERRRVEDLQRQLVRSKNEYLALIGHELRTPLTSISAYTELLREADEATLVRDGPRLIAVVERNALQLREIINELLELSALDAGHADVRRTPMDLAEVVRDVVDRTRVAIGAAPVAIDTDLPAELIVPGDRDRLRHIVENLIGSAIRYSPDGGHVEVRLRRAGRAAELAVSDAAVDVPQDEREKLFTGRYRTSRGHERTLPGSGLGLTLSRAVVERHHGSIELTGDGDGTTVLVRLPLDAR
ncbi:histidine kinase [Actinoplanes sp. SE50]|uniref:sensor histidine kinase n=1 Tax=unclassified Actinoplanes TaxID=2626549 RepID=UPI00023EC190|nr:MULTISPECIES: ATP-binding protein [unclassified Actinoplanes]AEV87519.1 multi-sensor signal transduction histidine kinase [Actinoplanes sp. SE50/110]ATO85922.1 histidine kinase [Actinoplanes sp. SE50]SLM03336.1 histidine kinase [Actinoplanes sp. SE50/110]